MSSADTAIEESDLLDLDRAAEPVWTLGERMWKARKDRGWEQADVAAAVGVSRPLVSKWERDQSVPDAIQIRKFADATGVTFTWLTASPCFWPIPDREEQMELALGLERPVLVSV